MSEVQILTINEKDTCKSNDPNVNQDIYKDIDKIIEAAKEIIDDGRRLIEDGKEISNEFCKEKDQSKGEKELEEEMQKLKEQEQKLKEGQEKLEKEHEDLIREEEILAAERQRLAEKEKELNNQGQCKGEKELEKEIQKLKNEEQKLKNEEQKLEAERQRLAEKEKDLSNKDQRKGEKELEEEMQKLKEEQDKLAQEKEQLAQKEKNCQDKCKGEKELLKEAIEKLKKDINDLQNIETDIEDIVNDKPHYAGNHKVPTLGNGLDKPFILDYYPAWGIYKPEDKDPVTLPGYIDDDSITPRPINVSDALLKNTVELKKSLPYIDRVSYSFLEIKQNEQMCFDDGKECKSETAKYPDDSFKYLSNYTTDSDKAGRVMFIDPWSDFAKQPAPKWENGKSVSTGLVTELVDFLPDSTMLSNGKFAEEVDPIADPWSYANYGSFEAFLKGDYKKIIAIGGYGKQTFDSITGPEKERLAQLEKEGKIETDKWLLGWKAALDHPENFANSVIELAKKCKFDGIDIDFEPLKDITKQGTDKFVNLMKVLRETADKEGLDKFEISFPITPDTTQIEEFGKGKTWEELMKYIDYVGIMGYDMAGGFDCNGSLEPGINEKCKTWLHSNLYKDSGANPKFSDEACVEALHSAGVPYERMIMGVPAYSRGQKGVQEDGVGKQAQSGYGVTDEGAGITYYKKLLDIIESKDAEIIDVIVEDGAHKGKITGSYVNYTDDKGNRIFDSLDSVEAIKEKARFANEHKMAGYLVWDMAGDTSDPNNSLLKVLSEVSKEYAAKPKPYSNYSSNVSENHSECEDFVF